MMNASRLWNRIRGAFFRKSSENTLNENDSSAVSTRAPVNSHASGERRSPWDQPKYVVGTAKFAVGDIVRHRKFPFRGLIYDIDPVFANSEDWYDSIPEEVRPAREQPYYHLFAENDKTHYVAYVSEQNLIADDSGQPVNNPDIETMFQFEEDGSYKLFPEFRN